MAEDLADVSLTAAIDRGELAKRTNLDLVRATKPGNVVLIALSKELDVAPPPG